MGPAAYGSDTYLHPLSRYYALPILFMKLYPQPSHAPAAFLGDSSPLLEAKTLAPFGYRDTLSYAVAANWQGGLDPQYEGYHVGTVHALTIREISVTTANPFSEFRKMAFAGPHAAGWSRGNADWRPRAASTVHTVAVQTRGARTGRAVLRG